MIHARHPLVVTVFLHHLEGVAVTPCLSEAREIAHGLARVGFEPLSWGDVVAGARPSRNKVEEFEWNVVLVGNTRPVHAWRGHRDSHIFPCLADPAKALLRSQGGLGSGLAFSTSPMCRITRLGSHHFLLLRRLQLLLPLTVRPPTRYLWPSPRCFRTGWGLGEEGVCSGECGGPYL